MVKLIVENPKGIMLVNSLDKNNESPAHLAASQKNMNILNFLVKNGAFLDQPNAQKMDVISVIPDQEMKSNFVKGLKKVKLSEKNSLFLE